LVRQSSKRSTVILIDRRSVISGLACAAAAAPAALSVSAIGSVESAIGPAHDEAHGVKRPLATGAEIFIGDLVSTGEAARLAMLLGAATRVRMGSRTRLRIDRFLADARGELSFDSGPLLIDRPEGSSRGDLRLRSPYGVIALRGTRVFAGPSKGAFGVFVERGVVDFTAGGATVRLTAGEGSDVRRPGDKPSPPSRWGSERVQDALMSVY
jgi:hypothetical protein